MIYYKKIRPLKLLMLLLPVVIVATLPGTVVAQTCPSKDSYPRDLYDNVADLYENLGVLQSRSENAITRFKDILDSPKVSPEVSLGEYFETLLVENVFGLLVAEKVPGVKVVKSTLLGMLAFDAENRAAFDSRKRRNAYDWVAREKSNLANIYQFRIETRMRCAYAKIYVNTPPSEQDEFVAAVGVYAIEIEKSIKHEDQIVVEYIEHWINSSVPDFSNTAEGFLIARVEFNDPHADGIVIKSLKVGSPVYSQQLGNNLNLLLNNLGKRPFDLKVPKVILFHDLLHFRTTAEQIVDSRRTQRTVCEANTQCIAGVFLDKNNKFVLPPLGERIISAHFSVKSQNYEHLGKFTK